MGKFNDLTGKIFGKLTVIKRVEKPADKKSVGVYWLCDCDCGNNAIRTSYQLKRKDTTMKSCGCYVYEFAKTRKIYNKTITHENYIEILSNDKSILIDREDYEKLKEYHWKIHKNYAIAQYYKNGKPHILSMHHLIIGKPEKGYDVDHINRNSLDNRKNNLRTVKHYQNKQNVKLNINNSTGYRNISYIKKTGLYEAHFTYKSKKYNLGLHKTIDLALEKLKKKRKLIMDEEDYKIYEDSLFV